MTTRVFRYGIRPPTVNADLVLDQMQYAHRYQNTLTEIERERREAIRAATAPYPQIETLTAEVATAEIALEEALALVKGKRQADRRRSENDVDKQRIKSARETLAVLRVRLRDTRRTVYAEPAVVAAWAAAEERASTRRRESRGVSGVY